MVSYRDGRYYGNSDDEWPTENVENGAEGIMFDGGKRYFDAEANAWVDWTETAPTPDAEG